MFRITCCLSILISLTQVVQAQSKIIKNEKGLLWRISGNGLAKPSYIFGTFHLGIKPDKSLIDSCKKFIKKSDVFFGELDIDAAGQNPQLLAKMGSLEAGHKLAELYSESDYATIKKYIHDSLGMDEAEYDGLKPMMVNMMMSIMYMSKQPGMDDINYSVDKDLQQMAGEMNVVVQGFETVEQQAHIMFNEISLKDQADYLLESIKSNQLSGDSIQLMMKQYTEGDLNALNATISQTMNNNFTELFLSRRNQAWVKTMLPLIESGKSLFVAVGAGHLTGDQGLIQLFRKKGYTVKPVRTQINKHTDENK